MLCVFAALMRAPVCILSLAFACLPAPRERRVLALACVFVLQIVGDFADTAVQPMVEYISKQFSFPEREAADAKDVAVRADSPLLPQ